jgi:AcrR family transcriptional regulator
VSTTGSRTTSTRVAILDAAVKLFMEQAERPDEIRMADIAKKAGVSRRTIYVHFGSRTSLLVAMVQHFDDGGILQGLIQRVLDAPTSDEALDAVVHLHAEYSPVAYPVARVLMLGRHADEALSAAWNDRMEARRDLYASLVTRLQRDGLLSPGWDVRTAIDMAWALTSWQLWEQLVVDQGWSKEQYRRYLRMVLHHVLTQGPE